MVQDSLGRTVQKPQYGGTFTYAWTRNPRGFDNAFLNRSSLWALSITNEELVKNDWLKGPSGTGETEFIVPTVRLYESWTGSLAESWEIPDEETIIYHIRKGVYWQNKPPVNGRQFDASDVLYTFTRNYDLDGNNPKAYFYTRLTAEEFPLSVTTPDKWTVVVKVNKGYLSAVLEALSDFQIIYPPEPVAEYGDLKDWKSNVGTGPYILVDHLEGSASSFVRNPNYWGMDPLHPENQLPYPDALKMLVISDRSTRMAAFRTGKIDHLGVGRDGVVWDEAVTVRQTSPQAKELQYTQYDAITLQLRTDQPELPISDLRVRRAIAMAIDQQGMVRDYYSGNAALITHLVAPLKGWDPMHTPFEEQPEENRELFEYHPDKAKQLLAEAGYPEGFQLKVLVQSNSTHLDLLSVVESYLAQVGIEIVPDVKERSVFLSIQRNRTHEEAVFSTNSVRVPFSFQPFHPTDGNNTAMIDDPYANEVRAKVKASYLLDEPSIHPIMKEFNQWMIGQAFYIEIPVSYFYAFWWPWVKGYNGEMVPGYTNDFVWTHYLWVDQDLKKEMGY
jgi:peptide/nickel transport system substrate-binding protein